MDEKRDVGAMARDVTTRGKAAAESMFELTRAVLLSGVGVAGLAMDEAKAFVDKLVDRGEIAEKDAVRLMDDLAQRSKKRAQQSRSETEHQLTEALRRLGVPTRADIADLNAKVAALSAKIDELISSRAGNASEPPPPPPPPPFQP